MIWFACTRCGKRHKQPTEAAGSLVFCQCGQANRVPWESTVAAPRPSAESEGQPGRRRRSEAPPRDPAFCLEHPAAPSVQTCPDCGEAFCPRCLVEFQGAQVCGPCKNLRVRRLQRPTRVAGMAIIALIAGLLSAPLFFCVTIVIPSESRQPETVLVCGVIGMGIGAAALLLGLLGVREAEKDATRTGRGLALTGAAFGTAGLIWSLSLVVTMLSRLASG
jgi:hypothetical protein